MIAGLWTFVSISLVQTIWMFYRDIRLMSYQERLQVLQDAYDADRLVLNRNYKNAVENLDYWKNKFHEAMKLAEDKK